MPDSLTIILPVHNSAAKLQRHVRELLDVLPELTPAFEVLIVDDASTDQTEEVAHELAREFPQIRVLRCTQRSGLAGAISTGLAKTSGQIVFVQEQVGSVRSADLSRLWSMRGEEQLGARTVGKKSTQEPTLIERLLRWGTVLKEVPRQNERGALHMIHFNRPDRVAPTSVPAPILEHEDAELGPLKDHSRSGFLDHLQAVTLGRV